MDSEHQEPKLGGGLQQDKLVFDGVAVRSTIQQIGAINIQVMNREQFEAITQMLSQILQSVGVPDKVSTGASPAHLSRGAQQVVQAVVQKVEEAEQRFDTPVGDPVMYFKLGNAALDAENYEEALRYHEQALAIDPKYAQAWLNRGVALGNLERYKEAIASYDKALAIDPKDAMAWYGRAYELSELGRDKEAIASYDNALAIDPKYADAWYNRGTALHKFGREKEAKESFKKAEELRNSK